MTQRKKSIELVDELIEMQDLEAKQRVREKLQSISQKERNLMKKKFCPLMKQECREDCSWYRELDEDCTISLLGDLAVAEFNEFYPVSDDSEDKSAD